MISLIFTACVSAAAFSREDIETETREDIREEVVVLSPAMSAAIAEGVIVPPGQGRRTEEQPELVEAQIGNIINSGRLYITARYINYARLDFERYYGRFAGVFVEEGQRVRQGDLLSEQFFDNLQPDLVLQRYNALFRLEELGRRFRDEQLEWTINLENARFAAEFESDPKQLIDLARLETAYRQFLLEHEAARLIYEQRVEAINESLREGIYAPFDGKITAVSERVRFVGDHLHRGFLPFVAVIVDENSDYLFMYGTPVNVRYGKIFTVEGFDGEMVFQARVVHDIVAPGRFPLLHPDRYRRHFLLRPVDQAAFDAALAERDMTFFDLAVQQISFRAVAYGYELLGPEGVILPLRALREENDLNYVYIYENGRTSRRNVILGASHGALHVGYIQILCGLEAGQLVAIP